MFVSLQFSIFDLIYKFISFYNNKSRDNLKKMKAEGEGRRAEGKGHRVQGTGQEREEMRCELKRVKIKVLR